MLFDSWVITWWLIANIALMVISLGTYAYNEIKDSDYLHKVQEMKDRKEKKVK